MLVFFKDRLFSKISAKKQMELNQNDRFRFFNWWGGNREDMWLYKFVKLRGLIPEGHTISFFSVFGRRNVIEFVKEQPKVFFCGENVHQDLYFAFSDYALKDGSVDLAIGFDFFESDKYIRFPLWISYMFDPVATETEICKRCEELRYPRIGQRTKFASMIARYDLSGMRSEMCNSLSNLGKVYCPSIILHNDDSLHVDYCDDKIGYLRQFYFNICPENSNAYGYVTEKIFEAIASGCIPVYWGSYSMPELDVLNQDAILFWEKDKGNVSIIETIDRLISNDAEMDAFIHQPRLKEGAEKIVIGYFARLENSIRRLYQ